MSTDGQRLVRIATRASAQALAQAGVVADVLRAAHVGLDIELVHVETTGDQRQDVALHTIGGQGVFVKEIQRAVLDGRADLAVHSAKDVPSTPVDGLHIAAFAARRDARDALVGRGLAELGEGATVATGSVRRRAQLRAARPDLQFVELRGNIHTRLGKVPADGAIVMAVAALQILGLTERIAERLPADGFVPAPGQGAVAVECRAADDVATRLCAVVDHLPTRRAVETERAFLAELGSGCSLPLGAHVAGGVLHAFLADPATGRVVREALVLPSRADAALDGARACASRLARHLGAR